jgi:hypothetical protein
MMFGGKLFPSLPPIIKASEGPNKIIPSQSDSQADSSGQAGVTGPGTGEKLVSREEQPLNMQTPPSTAPRVISTIPIMPAPGAVSPGSPQVPSTIALPPPSAAPPLSAPSTPAAAGTPFPPPPAGPAAASPAPSPNAMPPAAAVTGPAAISTAPKKIHTVVIRADQSGAMNVAAAAPESPAGPAVPVGPAPTTAPRTPVAPAARPRTPSQAGANGPMDILPGGEPSLPPAAPPPRTGVARVEPANGPIALETGSSAALPAGGYAVQLTSQRSEEEAKAAYRALQAKFPSQLGDRAPIIRRADLGSKGIYYRALIGPFASVEEAAGMCSKLKAAGGTCLVQRD